MNLTSLKHIHFVGIGGMGISYLAQYFLHRGVVVTGSDLGSSPMTDLLKEKGAHVKHQHDPLMVSDGVELLVYSNAVPKDNPERVAARALDIPEMTSFELAGLLSQHYKTIAVSGNKGKTTITAMIATILESAQHDPTAMVGSLVNDWEANYRHGESDTLVIESCEYRRQFLSIEPDIAVVANIGLDHMDYYTSADDVLLAFQQFIDNVPANGLVVLNADDEMTKGLTVEGKRVVTFGVDNEATLKMESRSIVGNGIQSVTVMYKEQEFSFDLPAPGLFNVYNAMAAALVCLEKGLSVEEVAIGLSKFSGTWRRFQKMGQYKEATIINDYAHNPPALKGVISAAQEVYPDARIISVFQPHTRHRTLSLFDALVDSLKGADITLIPDIYTVEGREAISHEEMNAEKLVAALSGEAHYSGDLNATKTLLDSIIQPGDIVLLIGAGTIYRLGEELTS